MVVRFVLVFALVVAASMSRVSAVPQSRATGDAVKGKAVFEQCVACHALDDPKSSGPSLKGVFGRKAGSRDDFRYSAAMSRSGIVWDAMTLDAYLANPQNYIRGNRMSFAGVPEKTDRDDLIAYLEEATTPTPQR